MAYSLVMEPDKLKEFKMREMNRILDIPVNKPMSEEFHKKFSKATLLPSSEIDCLLTTQSEAIKAYLLNGGLFGYIGVGKGKGLISLACATAAYRKGLRKILLLIPSSLTIQTVEKVVPWVRRQMPVNLPVHVISGKTAPNRLKASMESSGLFIMSWSQLSSDDTEQLFVNMHPQLIIADEAHSVSNKGSVRGGRVGRWMTAYPETEFIALSGTMGKKSILDYYHLMQWALKENCPMPDTDRETKNWSSILDASFSEYTSSGLLHPLLLWARRNGLEVDRDIAGYRKAYNHRLATTSGVVFAVGEDDLGTSITFCNKEVIVPPDYPGMPELDKLRDQLKDMSMSPNGDILEHAFHKFKVDYELSAGFYNLLFWPELEDISKRKEISMEEAEDLLDRSKDYHRASQDYSRAIRKWLGLYACENLDSPLILHNSMLHHGPEHVGDELYSTWVAKRSFDFEGRLKREKKPVRVCDYKIQACLDWVKSLPKKRGGVLIWYKNTEMGRWCFEVLKAAGLDVVLCDASKQGKRDINNEEYHASKIMISSISANKEGINAQGDRKSGRAGIEHVYCLQFPREAHHAEQLIGRNHRTGTPYDELTYTTNFSNEFDITMYSAVLADALFQHQAGSEHKLIYGNYEEPPKIAHAAAVKEMGLAISDRYGTIEKGLNQFFN